MSRQQLILVVFLLAASWLGMQIVHEFGHVLGAWWTGGEIVRVVLRPWVISRTDLGINPEPLMVAAAGPLIGAVLPLVVWLAAAACRVPGTYLLRFFAGFCLIANGAYMAGATLDRIGDAGIMRGHGLPAWPLFVFAALTMPLGLWLWHRQGVHFGFGGAGGKVSLGAMIACVLALVVAIIVDFVWGSA
jgi:hypothetical protein